MPRVGARATSTSGTPLTERIGFWIDTDDAYFTLSNDYIESVWWSLKEVWDKGLLTEGHKVVPVLPPRAAPRCPRTRWRRATRTWSTRRCTCGSRCATTRASSLLAWTTMPWTLVPHAAIAVDPEVTYVRARLGDERLILAEALVERVLGEEAEIEERMPGSALLGLRYEPPFPYISDYGERGHTVLAGDFVSVEDGTGVVHTGAAFGEDDFRLAAGQRADDPEPGAPRRHLRRPRRPLRRHVRARGGPEIIEALRESGRLFRAGEYEHAYPHCWRCGTPLIYYAKTNWYVRTTEVKDQLLAANEAVTWYPEHIKHGRFGNWLENNVDWALSRERYWGTPLPIWRCEEGHVVCVGSRAELEERGGRGARRPAPALHRRGRPALRLRRGHAPRARPDRRLVGLGLHAVRPVARAVRERGQVPRALPGRLHLRGARPDARLVLLAARASRRSCSGRAPTGPCSASA